VKASTGGELTALATTSTHDSRLNLSGWVAPLLARHSLMRTQHANREGYEATTNRWFETLDEIWYSARLLNLKSDAPAGCDRAGSLQRDQVT
jgi:hypothetical protein